MGFGGHWPRALSRSARPNSHIRNATAARIAFTARTGSAAARPVVARVGNDQRGGGMALDVELANLEVRRLESRAALFFGDVLVAVETADGVFAFVGPSLTLRYD